MKNEKKMQVLGRTDVVLEMDVDHEKRGKCVGK